MSMSNGSFTILATDTVGTTKTFNLPAAGRFIKFTAARNATADTLTSPGTGEVTVISTGGVDTAGAMRCVSAAVRHGDTCASFSNTTGANALAGRAHRNDCVVMRARAIVGGGTAGKLSVTSMSTSGPNYTVTCTIDEQFDFDMLVTWEAVTDSGVTVTAHDITTRSTAGSMQLGFGGDFFIFMGCGRTAINTALEGALLVEGYADKNAANASPYHQALVGFSAKNWTSSTGDVTNTLAYARYGQCCASWSPVSGTVWYGQLTAVSSSDGTLTFAGGGGAATLVSVFAFSGVNALVSTVTTVTNTTSDVPVGGLALGFTPSGGFTFGAGCADRTANTTGSGGQIALGGTTGQSATFMQMVAAQSGVSTSNNRYANRTAGVDWSMNLSSMAAEGKVNLKASTGFADPMTFRMGTADDVGKLMGVAMISPASTPLTPGNLSTTSVTALAASFSCTSPTGGTAPITQQLYRADRGQGNWQAITSATSLTPTDTGADGTTTGFVSGSKYDFKITFTDNLGATADSNTLQVDVPQVARPTTVDAQGNWTGAPSAINEVTRDDSTYVSSSLSPVSPDLFRVRVTALSTPENRDNHNLQYVIAKDSPGGDSLNLTVRLVEYSSGAWVTRVSWVHLDVQDTPSLVTQTLTNAQASTIVDYSNLALEFEAVKA